MKINQHRVASVIGLAGGVALIALVLIWQYQLNHEPVSRTDSSAQVVVESEPKTLNGRWLLAGEIFWARQMEQEALKQPEPYTYLFSQLKTLEPNKYDAWLGHMECPITDNDIPYETQVSSLVFNCRPEYLPEFAKFFDAVSLANNHMGDAGGVNGLKETRANLQKHGVQYYGHFENATLDDICEVISLPVRVGEHPAKLPVAMCGYHNVFRLPTSEELDVISRYSKNFFTIVSAQQGAEYEPEADSAKVSTYRAMIDRGADMVVASHPHWVQNTEVYKDKLIMYSVGNFMFDQEWSEEVKRGVALDLSLSAEVDDNLTAWLELDCSKFKDDCLEQAKSLVKPDLGLSFELVSVYHEDVLTQKASKSVHQANLERTNWAETLESLRQTQ